MSHEDMAAGRACAMCGQWTQTGREYLARQARESPIFGTNFTEPLSTLVEDARKRIAGIRGTLGDISSAYPGWGERLKDVEGLLTCGLIALYGVWSEMLGVETRAANLAREHSPSCSGRHEYMVGGRCIDADGRPL